MAIQQYLGFSYAGIESSEHGIVNVNIRTGLLTEPLVPNRILRETEVRGRARPYFHEIQLSPRVMNLSFAFMEKWREEEEDKLREVVNWLCGQDYYKPFYFIEEPDRIYYVLVIDNPELVHNAAWSGYMNLTLRANSPYAYSQVQESEEPIVCSGTTDFMFENEGDILLKPLMEIFTISAGDISIINESDNDREFSLTGLADAETIYIDNDNQFIETDIYMTYRYGNHNNVFLELLPGENNLKVLGNCQLRFRYQFIYR